MPEPSIQIINLMEALKKTADRAKPRRKASSESCFCYRDFAVGIRPAHPAAASDEGNLIRLLTAI